jgi:hypothetical protein
LSFSERIERKDSSLRTEEGRLRPRDGDCTGESIVGFKSPNVSFSLPESPDDDLGNVPGIWSGVVGCDDSGPPPDVAGRGVAGGESRGAGIFVPSVREKDTGVIVRGLNAGGAMFGTNDEYRGGRVVLRGVKVE